jgi:hypothetical protein
MGNQLGTLQNLSTHAIVESNVKTTITLSRIPPIVENEEEYLDSLPNEFVVIQVIRLWACRRRIELVIKAKARLYVR